MNQCCGITNKHARCRNKARFKQIVHGAEFDVCKMHQKLNLLAKWDRELRLIALNSADRVINNPVPTDVYNWLQNFHECWRHTNNLHVSTKFASAIFRAELLAQNFDMKFDLYINTLLTENTESSAMCSVCLEDDIDVLNTNQCQHTFCLGCIKKWMSTSVTCPVCRRIL